MGGEGCGWGSGGRKRGGLGGTCGGRIRTGRVGERVCAGSGGWEGGMLGVVEGEGMGPLEGGEVVWDEWFGLTCGREVMGGGGKGRDRTGGGGRVVGGGVVGAREVV